MCMSEQETRLIQIRHGESWGNKPDGLFEDSHLYEAEDTQWTLRNKGIEQGDITGNWLRNELSDIDYVVVSPAVRTKQTAYALSLTHIVPKNEWIEEPLASERNWGKRSTIATILGETALSVQGDVLHGRPGPYSEGSQSLMEVRNDSATKLVKKLGEFALGKTVVLVGHGEMMGIVAAEIMDLSEDEWRKRIDDPEHSIGRIPNGGVIEFRSKDKSVYLPPSDTEIRIVTPAGPDREYNSGWLSREEFIDQ